MIFGKFESKDFYVVIDVLSLTKTTSNDDAADVRLLLCPLERNAVKKKNKDP